MRIEVQERRGRRELEWRMGARERGSDRTQLITKCGDVLYVNC